ATALVAATLVAATLVATALVAATLVATALVAATLVAATLVATALVAATLVAATLVAATLVATALVATATDVSATDGVLLAPAQQARLDLDLGDARVDADLQRLRRTGRGQRGTRGDDRTSGDPRDADTRLLRHVLLPPVADLVIGAAICGPWPCGESLSASPRRVVVTSPAPRFTPVPDIRMLL
ncbi:hypothetical protein, partial [Streptomyces sp. rh34]|uniref:hypothetical protein n=1 Tax=Streptomyces sp. rh34 TaxID=2034272 RepID=UPI0015CF61B3